MQCLVSGAALSLDLNDKWRHLDQGLVVFEVMLQVIEEVRLPSAIASEEINARHISCHIARLDVANDFLILVGSKKELCIIERLLWIDLKVHALKAQLLLERLHLTPRLLIRLPIPSSSVVR